MLLNYMYIHVVYDFDAEARKKYHMSRIMTDHSDKSSPTNKPSSPYLTRGLRVCRVEYPRSTSGRIDIVPYINGDPDFVSCVPSL